MSGPRARGWTDLVALVRGPAVLQANLVGFTFFIAAPAGHQGIILGFSRTVIQLYNECDCEQLASLVGKAISPLAEDVTAEGLAPHMGMTTAISTLRRGLAVVRVVPHRKLAAPPHRHPLGLCICQLPAASGWGIRAESIGAVLVHCLGLFLEQKSTVYCSWVVADVALFTITVFLLIIARLRRRRVCLLHSTLLAPLGPILG